MPIYEYGCRGCGRTVEALRRMTEADAALTCEHCGSGELVRKHSVFTASASQALPIAGGGGAGGCGCGNPHGPCAMG